MFLRILKAKKGDATYQYLKLVESVREKGKTKQVTLLNFGNVDNWPPEKLKTFIEKLTEFYHFSDIPIHPQSAGLQDSDFDPKSSLTYGPFYAADAIWNKLHMDALLTRYTPNEKITIDWLMAVKVMVFNRLVNPESKLAITRWLARQAIPGVYPRELPVHYYYRSLDYLIRTKDELEKDIFFQVNDLFSLDLSIVFYDLTSSYFEGEACPIAKRGYSRDHRPDCKQIELALVINRDGIPIAHEVWEGNVKDCMTVADAVSGLQKRFNIKRVIFVGDNGMNTSDNIEKLRNDPYGYEYIMSLKPNKDSRVADLVEPISLRDKLFPEKAGFVRVKDNFYVKELERPASGFHDDERIILAFNPVRGWKSASKHRQKIKKAVLYLESFKKPRKKGQTKKPEKIHQQIARRLKGLRLADYFTYTFHKEGDFQYRLDKQKVIARRKRDGLLFLVATAKKENFSAEEVATAYRMLSRIEADMRVIKDVLKIRPIRHYRESRVRGHVFVCILGLLLERLLELQMQRSGLEMTAPAMFEKLKSLRLIHYTLLKKELYKTTKPEKEQLEIFKRIGAPGFRRVPKFTENLMKTSGVV